MIKYNTQSYIIAAKEKFGDKFDYSKTIYVNSKTPIIIICPVHGEFTMNPISHLNSKTGCRKCSYASVDKKLVDGKDRKSMREYSIWKGMKTRTNNPNTETKERYIDRNIKCCDEWLNSFETFYADMGPCPEGYTLDRIDNNGIYCKDNCRWASYKQQSQNRGEFNLIYTYNGETHVLKEWAEILGIKYTTLYQRLYRSNMSFEEAISVKPEDHLTEFNGEYKTLKEWCSIYNIKYQTVLDRIHKHKWTLERALTTPKRTTKN